MTTATATPVYLEVGRQRVFAGALEWPGWCRAGKTEPLALAALAASAPRYAAVAREAGIPFPAEPVLEVVERLPGSATTDFGAPDAVAAADRVPLSGAEAERLAALVGAAWVLFDRVAAAAPAELRKGPRGGGRDRDKLIEHVLAAEVSYARKLGVKLRQPSVGDVAAIDALRGAIAGALRAASGGPAAAGIGWPPRYAARRIAWHVLDHAWEMEERGAPPT